MKNEQYNFDVIIIGSGVAGLSAALHLAKSHQVAILSKSALQEGSSLYAQGGIAAVLSDEDSIESHVEDTLKAGAGLCNREAVEFTVRHSTAAIEWLIGLGVDFTKVTMPDGTEQYHLTKEGGHSKRRIIHAADATGRSVVGTLISEVKRHANISLFEYQVAVDFTLEEGRVSGVYVLDEKSSKVNSFGAKAVILATGGASRAYLYSTNPAVSSGDGIAMAYRAGATVGNLEFNQFHPTCLYHPKAGSFLITEAMRGEGGFLRLPDGSRFMPHFHEWAELAPRDIVARAIDHEMKRLGLDCVYLDITHKGEDFIKQHFPTIYERCLSFGLDITKEQIPVVPAAHYTCGGVKIDEHGRTDVPGLYACGEVGFTGLHGANRMASNSLLECLVYARAASEDIERFLTTVDALPAPLAWDASQVGDSDEAIVVKQNWDEVRQLMWNYVGIVRSDKRLARAKRRVDILKEEIQEYYAHFKVDKDLLELRNLVLLADLIIQSAMTRKESRGLHFNVDYPDQLDHASDTLIQK